MQRYFISIDNGIIRFLESDIFHIQKVMRNKVGDNIQIVSDGKAYLAEISSINPLEVFIVNPILNESELGKELTLFFPLTKSDKAELVIQKATELGASKIVFFRCKRCVIKLDDEAFKKKAIRYNTIAKEAAEQCHRNKIPEIIGVLNIKDIFSYLSSRNFVAYELLAGNTTNLYDELKDNSISTSLIVGPEGGFEEKEVDELVNMGFKAVSLGKRILRCETAAIYGLSVISFFMEK